jgi:restriction system protein
LKHWRVGTPVGKGAISDFVKVIIRENRTGGLFLATSGYTGNAAEAIAELTKQKLRLGDKTKVVTLCQT